MVDLEVGVEGRPLIVEVVGARVGNMNPSDRCPRSAEITDKVTSLGSRQVVQGKIDCWGFHFREKKEDWVGKVEQTRRIIYHGVEGFRVVEDSKRCGGICVDNGENTEEVGNYWVDGGCLLEGPYNSGCIITSSEGCKSYRGFAYCQEGGFIEDQRG